MSAPSKPETRREELADEPWRFDILALLRELERMHPDKPRIGRASVMREEIVRLGQDPFYEFPASNIQSAEFEKDGPVHLRARFLGFFGPQGALPLLTTLEAYRWQQGRDDSFVRFVDIFATRLMQLFFRAWADARPIAQFDRPNDDRFADYVGSMIGIGTPDAKGRDSIPDCAKLPYAGLMAGRVKSAARLQTVIRGILGVEARLRERVGMWLDFEQSDLTRMGRTGAELGRNTHAGARVYSINDKAVIEIRTTSYDEYRSFLPGQPAFQHLADIVRFYLGETVDFDVELTLPATARPAARLGQAGQLGWTSWANPGDAEPGESITGATFSLHEAA
ncbi:type VI secretion system baseplate subunit TssG [Tropicimonas sp. IMCC34011]|uniref:type VI secretion system baseplate subunit TssG n=1 Tax=Tropicimonas sp. IMCC34011 TaxID=2248759 RepID=UPI000E23EA8F|nr:type VI secretion system baseplate subunit TssG [Tropicimonas sp. IMCC34011]